MRRKSLCIDFGCIATEQGIAATTKRAARPLVLRQADLQQLLKCRTKRM